MSRTICAIALVTAIAAGAVPSAYASGDVYSIDLGDSSRSWHGLGGPVFAGDALVWGRPARDGFEIVTNRPYREKVRLIRFRAPAYDRGYYADLSGSPGRIGVSLDVSTCADSGACKYGDYGHPYTAALTGPPRGPFDVLASGCDVYGYDEANDAPPIEVDGQVIAYADCDNSVHVRDATPGAAPPGRDYPPAERIKLAGSFIARQAVDGSVTTVSNWREGADLFSVPTARFDLQDDGTLAFTTADGQDVAWASVSDPTAHVIARARDASPRVYRNRIAYSWRDNPLSVRTRSFEVRSLDGDLVASTSDSTAQTDADFDGFRLAWIDKPCEQGQLVVWDGAGSPPTIPGACPLPKVETDSARFNANLHPTVVLACGRFEELGCGGLIGVRHPSYRHARPRRGVATFWSFEVDPGTSRRVPMPRTGRPFCIDRQSRVRTQIVVFSQARAGPDGGPSRAKTRLVSFKGSTRGLKRCT